MPDHPPPSCPRCAYDLSGTAFWTDACPLIGVCSECGLSFEWGRVLRAHTLILPWFIEHSVTRLWRSAWKTLYHILLPHRFFRALTLEHIRRPARTFLWLPLLLAPILLAAAAAHELVVLLYVVPNLRPPLSAVQGIWHANAFAEPFLLFDIAATPAGTITGWTFSFRNWPYFLLVAGMFAPWPISLFVLPVTRARAKVRASTISRLFIYSLWWLVPLALLRLVNAIYMLITTNPTVWWYGYGHWVTRIAGSTWGLALLGLMYLWCAWWWYAAISIHMRLQQPRRVWAASMAISFLCLALAMVTPMGLGWHTPGVLTSSGIALAALLTALLPAAKKDPRATELIHPVEFNRPVAGALPNSATP